MIDKPSDKSISEEIDRRSHKRIDDLTDKFVVFEKSFVEHMANHVVVEKSLSENTRLTKEIALNTKELVTLFKGAKAARTFMAWMAPIVGAGLGGWAVIEWISSKGWLK